MAVRTPLYLLAPVGEPFKQVYPYASGGVDQINQLAGFAFATNPNPRIEIGGSNGDLLANQPFVDTWWSAGAGTTDATNYDTEAETPNVFKVTDNYNTVRVVYDAVTLPTGDTNNTQYPLYLYSPAGPVGDDWVDAGFRSMSRIDFIDTFVLPVLSSFGGGGQTFQKSGTYYMTTSTSPSNATIVGTAALNQEANPAAYSAAQIPEVPTQNNNVTTYSIAKVDYPSTASGLWEGAADPLLYDLPLYFDSGTESIKQHTPATWAALLNPFLRYYLGVAEATKLHYNIDGTDGVASGTVYTDTGIVTAGSTYNTRFVNANDYRTQEFPTGTATVISTKTFKIHQGPLSADPEVVSLEGTAVSPHPAGHIPVTDGTLIQLGWRFSSNGVVERYDEQDTDDFSATGHDPWCNITPTGTWYIKATVQSDTGDQTHSSIGTWITHTSGPTFEFTDSGAFGSYGQRVVVYKIEISRNNDGTNIAATGYYSCTYEGGA